MSAADPKEILTTLLTALGFSHEIREEGGGALQILTPEKELLIGPNGETLDDLQFLVNRLLQIRDASSPKVYLDVEGHRRERNDRLIAQVREYAELVRTTGDPYHLEPMNAYDRRLVHNALRDDPEVTTWSPQDDARVKRITLLRRKGK